jgi:tungstate transport system substrate-binding protein
MRARCTWWRFGPAAVLMLIVGALSYAEHAPLHLAASPAMLRDGFARRLAARFSRDTGLAVMIETISAQTVDQRIGRGDLDIVITHGGAAMAARDAAIRLQPALSTSYVIIGPALDPAHIRNAWSAMGAFERIAARHAPYQRSPTVSAASDVEASLSQAAEVLFDADPVPATVEGALARAAARGAYMLIDRPTFQRMGRGTNLALLFDDDPALRDVYTVAELRRGPAHEYAGRAFWRWLNSPDGRSAVRAASAEGNRGYFLVHEASDH